MSDNMNSFVKNIQNIARKDAGINGDAQNIEQLSWLLFLKVYDIREESWEIDDDDYQSLIPENCQWRNWAVDSGNGDALTGSELLQFVDNVLIPALKNITVTPETPLRQAIVPEIFTDVNNFMKDGVLLRKLVNQINALDLEDKNDAHSFNDIYESILKDLQSQRSSGEYYTPRPLTDFITEIIQPKLGDSIADLACGTGGFLTSALKILQKQVKTVKNQETYTHSVHGIEKKAFPYLLAITNLLLHGIDEPDIKHGNSLGKDVTQYDESQKFDVILMNPPYGGQELGTIQNNVPKSLRSSETADLFMDLIMYRLKLNGKAGIVLPDSILFDVSETKKNIKAKLFKDFNVTTIVRLPKGVFAPYTSINTNIIFFENSGTTKETWFYRLDLPEGLQSFSKTRPITSANFKDLNNWWKNKHEISINGNEKAKLVNISEIQKNEYDLSYVGYGQNEEKIYNPNELLDKYLDEKAKLDEQIKKLTSEVKSIFGGQDNV